MEVVSKCTCVYTHLHLCEQWVSMCMHAPFVWVADTHVRLPDACWNHLFSPSPPVHKPERLGNSVIMECNTDCIWIYFSMLFIHNKNTRNVELIAKGCSVSSACIIVDHVITTLGICFHDEEPIHSAFKKETNVL